MGVILEWNLFGVEISKAQHDMFRDLQKKWGCKTDNETLRRLLSEFEQKIYNKEYNDE